jgi:hypothetical protein
LQVEGNRQRLAVNVRENDTKGVLKAPYALPNQADSRTSRFDPFPQPLAEFLEMP